MKPTLHLAIDDDGITLDSGPDGSGNSLSSGGSFFLFEIGGITSEFPAPT